MVLRFYEDRTEADIASLLGIAPGTVKSTAAPALASSAPTRSWHWTER